MHDGTIDGEHSSDEVKVIEVQYEVEIFLVASRLHLIFELQHNDLEQPSKTTH